MTEKQYLCSLKNQTALIADQCDVVWCFNWHYSKSETDTTVIIQEKTVLEEKEESKHDSATNMLCKSMTLTLL